MEQISEMCAQKQVRLFSWLKFLHKFSCADAFSECVVFVCVGMFAIRAEREYVIGEDFMKAVRKVSDTKKLESKLDYKQI